MNEAESGAMVEREPPAKVPATLLCDLEPSKGEESSLGGISRKGWRCLRIWGLAVAWFPMCMRGVRCMAGAGLPAVIFF